jgi:hypothetical protein
MSRGLAAVVQRGQLCGFWAVVVYRGTHQHLLAQDSWKTRRPNPDSYVNNALKFVHLCFAARKAIRANASPSTTEAVLLPVETIFSEAGLSLYVLLLQKRSCVASGPHAHPAALRSHMGYHGYTSNLVGFYLQLHLISWIAARFLLHAICSPNYNVP